MKEKTKKHISKTISVKETLERMQEMAGEIKRTYGTPSQITLGLDMEFAPSFKTPEFDTENGRILCKPFADEFAILGEINGMSFHMYIEDFGVIEDDVTEFGIAVCCEIDDCMSWIQSASVRIAPSLKKGEGVRETFSDILDIMECKGEECESPDEVREYLDIIKDVPYAEIVICFIATVNNNIKKGTASKLPDMKISENQVIHLRNIGNGIVMACGDNQRLSSICDKNIPKNMN